MKNPLEEMATLGYGTELEYVGITRKNAATAIQSVVGGTIDHRHDVYDTWTVTAPDGRVWKAVSDSSLGDRNASAEVVTPILHLADLPILQEVVRALRHAGAKAANFAGQHIHVGLADFTASQIANLVRLFYKQEALILKAVGTFENRLNFTRPTDREFIERIEERNPQTFEDLNRAWFGRYTPHPQHYDGHRYRAVNLNNLWNDKKTVEFRFFNSTTHAGEIKANVQLALALAVKAKNAKSALAKAPRNFDFSTSAYDVRVFLLRLGFIGEEFKTARYHFRKHLGGSTAWKGGRRD